MSVDNIGELERKAKNGDVEAMVSLGRLYHMGDGVEQDIPMALDWYVEAAEAGSAEAMEIISGMYEAGDGLPKDESKAMMWRKRAEKIRDADSIQNLMSAADSGDADAQDRSVAAEWHRKAADAGCELAKHFLHPEGKPIAGETYYGIVKRIMDFGAFVEFMPGKEGLCHISKLSRKKIRKVEDVLKVGQMIPVKIIEIDEYERANLSYVDALESDGA